MILPPLVRRRSVTSGVETARRALGLAQLGMLMLGATMPAFLAYAPTAPVSGTPVELPWWVVAGMFLVAEVAVIHLPMKRNAHTISLSEIPLALGLVFAGPPALLIGRLVGSLPALVLYRRQAPRKVAFNTGLFAVETAVAVTVFRGVLGTASPVTPRGWAALLVAVGTTLVVTAALVHAALALHGGLPKLAATARSIVAGVFIGTGVAVAGLLCAICLWYEPRAGGLVAVGAAMLYMLVRVYGSLTRRHDELRAVYAFTNAANASLSGRAVQVATVREAAALLRAEKAALFLAGPSPGRVAYVAWDDREGLEDGVIDEGCFAALVDLAVVGSDERMAGAHATPPPLVPLFHTSRSCTLVSPVRMSDGTRGALVAAGRVGPDREYSREDLELLDAIASHSSLTLERALTVERLQAEIAANEELIASKDRLIATVSHELRTPLTGVLGFAEILRDSEDEFSSAERHGILASIADEARDMSNVVEDLLTAARAQMGNLSVRPAPICLGDIAKRVVDHAGDLDMSMNVVGDEGDAFADEARVRQILRNLVVNAARYGGRRVRIEVASGYPTSRVRVCDDGSGIPESMREQVFEPYESAHHSSTQPGSLGLGLSISRALARMMDGDLTYDYRGGWSLFELTLPRDASVSGSDELAAAG